MCSYSQALQNLRHSLRGPNPIYHDMENPVRKNTYNPYRQVPDGPDPIHNKMEGQGGANTYGIYRKNSDTYNPYR